MTSPQSEKQLLIMIYNIFPLENINLLLVFIYGEREMHTNHVMLTAFSENICDTEFTPFTMWLLRSKSLSVKAESDVTH